MAAKYWFALDYNEKILQVPATGVSVKRPFTFCINSGGGSINGVNKVTSLGSASPDILVACTIPGQGYGVMIVDYYVDWGILDTGGGGLVFEMGLLLTSTTNAQSTSSLDTGSTTMANAGFFATLIHPNASNLPARMSPVSMENNASTPAEVACTYATGALPVMITNLPNGNTGGNVATYPNSGLYDLIFQVTTVAGTVSATDAYLKGWIEYITLGSTYQV